MVRAYMVIGGNSDKAKSAQTGSARPLPMTAIGCDS